LNHFRCHHSLLKKPLDEDHSVFHNKLRLSPGDQMGKLIVLATLILAACATSKPQPTTQSSLRPTPETAAAAAVPVSDDPDYLAAIFPAKTSAPSPNRKIASVTDGDSPEQAAQIKQEALTALTAFAKVSCRISKEPDSGEWQLLDEASAFKIAHCLIETDSRKADSDYADAKKEDVMGEISATSYACTKAMNFTCGRGVLRAAQICRSRIYSPAAGVFIDKDGSYNFGGLGADSTSAIVIPGVHAKLTVSGHSEVLYLENKQEIRCKGEPSNCRAIVPLIRDSKYRAY
jgi:hypothetical protein